VVLVVLGVRALLAAWRARAEPASVERFMIAF
jgi:hypothetical protein